MRWDRTSRPWEPGMGAGAASGRRKPTRLRAPLQPPTAKPSPAPLLRPDNTLGSRHAPREDHSIDAAVCFPVAARVDQTFGPPHLPRLLQEDELDAAIVRAVLR